MKANLLFIVLLIGLFAIRPTTAQTWEWQNPLPQIKTLNSCSFIDAEKPVVLPIASQLSAYPNPFNSSTRLSFTLSRAGKVKLAIYDVLGRMVGDHMGSPLPYTAGEHHVMFDGAGLSSGIYFVRMEAEGLVQTRKIMLLR